MKYILSLGFMFLASCAIVPQPGAALVDQIKTATAAKAEAERTADSAIKTSADARKAESLAREEASAALALAAEKTGEADRLGREAVALRSGEISERITIYSWIMIGVGVITGVVGAFIGIRFQSKSGLTVALCGGIAVGAGIVGLFMAPHWLLVAWVFVVALIIGIIGLLVWLLLRHEAAGKVMASQWDGYAKELPENIRDRLDSLSKSEQPEHLRDLITSLMNKART
jgi:hypothetical protein